MLAFVSAPKGASNSILDRGRRPAGLWPLMIGLLASLAGLSAQAEPVAISPEGVRASAVDIAYDAKGTAWLLWVQKGARIPGAGHASADNLYVTKWASDAEPSEPVRVNEDEGSVRASALSRARIVVDNVGGVHVLYPVTGISPTTSKPVINVRHQKLNPEGAPSAIAALLNTPADNDLSSSSHSNVGAAATFLSLTAAPTGELFAFWLDTRRSPETSSNSWVYGTQSTDNGQTWAPDQPLFE